jgi:DNA repair ATPase RecN
LLAGLIERNPGEEMGWFWNIQELPEMPHASHLTQVLAQHEFQEAFKNWRDLQFLDTNLKGWQDNLGVYGDMLDNRRKAYADRLPKVLGQAGSLDLAAAQKKRDEVAGALARAESESDVSVFPDAKQQDLLARIESVEAALKPLGNDPEFAKARERLRLAKGALTWEFAQQFPDRLWAAKKDLAAIDKNLGEAKQHETNLAAAQKEEPAKFERFAQRIAALEGQIRGLIPRVADLSREQQEQVQSIAVAELQRQKERLAVYATQARFAVAQLYDRAKKSEDHATRPK